jgi:hypothetical protein
LFARGRRRGASTAAIRPFPAHTLQLSEIASKSLRGGPSSKEQGAVQLDRVARRKPLSEFI